jgi:hypothetical protein
VENIASRRYLKFRLFVFFYQPKLIFNTSCFLFFIWFGSVKTDLREEGANSTLFVARINKSDSGNYSCSIPKSNRFTVTVHVLNGKLIVYLKI